MFVIDTSALVGSLAGPRTHSDRFRALLLEGHRVVLPTLVLYEWLRGPRTSEEIAAQEAWMPRSGAVPFGVQESELAARFFRESPRARARQVDFAIAATAILRDLPLWTLNHDDFVDIPGLRLID